ncbi:MAG: ankyrin repeat domain-containing protein [Planctomycetota bacterium]|nr:ankyrin repeat domain-containing protein [Planctomycetota bacterium]
MSSIASGGRGRVGWIRLGFAAMAMALPATAHAQSQPSTQPASQPATLPALDPADKSTLWQAAKAGRLERVEALLANGAAVDAPDERGQTPLHLAAGGGHAAIVQALLAKGADANARSKSDGSPLLAAASRGSRAIVESLIEKGASIDAQDDAGLTPLLVAVWNNRLEAADLLLAKGAKVAGKAAMLEGQGPLHIAARMGNADLVAKMLERGGQVDARTTEQVTPLAFAVLEGKADVVELLLAKGADIKAKDREGRTPWTGALSRMLMDHNEARDNPDYKGQGKRIARLLLAKKPDLGAAESQGFTLLHVAALCGDAELAKAALDGGLPVDAPSKSGATPLTLASGAGQKAVAELLLDRGAGTPGIPGKAGNPGNPGNSGTPGNAANAMKPKLQRGPLHAAAEAGRLEELKSLLDHKLDINAQDERGETPLHRAIAFNQPEAFDLLLARGANIEVGDKYGRSALFAAYSARKMDYVRKLIQKGADLKTRDAGRATLLHVAAENQDLETIDDLLKAGLDINAPDSRGVTPWGKILRLVEQASGAGGQPMPKPAESAQRVAELPIMPLALALAAKGGDVNARSSDYESRCAIEIAVLSGNADFAKRLLARKPDLEARDVRGDTPLFAAIRNRRPEMALLLLDAGAEPNSLDKHGPTTPLHLAVGLDDKAVAEKLLAKGANIDATGQSPNNPGETPLHNAINWDRQAMAALLIDKGADVNAAGPMKETPLHYAVKAGRKEIVALLIKKGAQVNAESRSGQTPLDLATGSQRTEIAAMLVEAGGRKGPGASRGRPGRKRTGS